LELPLVILLILAIAYNDNSKELLKLYPLQILLILGMIFIFIYFFRLVKLNTDEVRCIGLFSSKDSAIIKQDKRLAVTLMSRGRLMIEVFGIGEAPLLDWVNPEDYKNSEINLFRTKCVGSKRAAKKILSYFDIDKTDFDKIFENESFEKEYEAITLKTCLSENGKEISLRFNKTL
jgi:hypothetical protein